MHFFSEILMNSKSIEQYLFIYVGYVGTIKTIFFDESKGQRTAFVCLFIWSFIQ